MTNYQAIAYSMQGPHAEFINGPIEGLRYEAKIMGLTMIVLNFGGEPLYFIGANGAVYRLQLTSRTYPSLGDHIKPKKKKINDPPNH